MKHLQPGIVGMGGYLPFKKLSEEQTVKYCQYLHNHTLFPKDYIKQMENTKRLPGSRESNFDGWLSKPWYAAWVNSLPEKKRSDPFQGTCYRRRVPMDPVSINESVYPHPMLPSDAETLAASICIVNTGINKDEIDLVITHSQVSDQPLPQNCSLVQHKLKLHNSGAYSVDTCCSSFVTMYEIASALVASGMKKNILIVSSFIDSHVNDRTTHFSIDTGDAAVAAIVTAVPEGYGFLSSHSISHGDRHDGIIYQNREPLLLKKLHTSPDYRQLVTTFYNPVACKQIALNAQYDMVTTAQEALSKLDLTTNDIDFFITHQPVHWAGNAWREGLNIPSQKFFETFKEYANIATCAAPVNLLEAIERRLIKTNDTILFASSGAGENHIAVVTKVQESLIKSLTSMVEVEVHEDICV